MMVNYKSKFLQRSFSLILTAGIVSNSFTIRTYAQDTSTSDGSIVIAEDNANVENSTTGVSGTGISTDVSDNNSASDNVSGDETFSEDKSAGSNSNTTGNGGDTEFSEANNEGAEKYIVTLDANGGSVSTQEIEVQKDSEYKDLPTPTREHYVFLGWSLIKTEDAKEATFVKDGSPIFANKDHVLYAIWDPEEYAVTLNAGDGIVAEDNSELIIYVNYDEPYGTYHRYFIIEQDENDETNFITKEGTPDDYTDIMEYEELPTPELEGYEFIGWSTEEIISEDDDKYLVSNDDKVSITEDHTLYARWNKKETVSNDDLAKDDNEITDDNDGTANDTDNSANKEDTDKNTNKDANKDTNKDTTNDIDAKKDTDGTDAISEDSDDPYEDEGSIDISSSLLMSTGTQSSNGISSSLLMTAAYTVTFKLQGGNFSDTDSVVFTVNAGDTIERPEDPTRTKYDFKGWYTSADGDAQFDFATPISCDTYIYAHWDAKYKAATPTVSVFRTRTDNSTGNEVGEDAQIKLTSSSYDAKIYYILNPASEYVIPTENDTLYTDVLTARKLAADDGTITIRTIAIKDGYEDSDVATFVFTMLPDSENWGELLVEDRTQYTDPTQIPNGMWFSGITDKTYSGSAITFSQNELRVYDEKKLLTFNTDYTVSYRNNTNAGTATITVTGKGNYSGSIQKTFKINPRDISEDSFNASDIVLQYTGRLQKGTTSLIFDNGSKKITLRAGSDFTYTYPNTDAKKSDYDNTAFVGMVDEDRQYQITITGKGNYTGTRTITQTIVSKDKIMLSKVSVSVPAASFADRNDDGFVCPVPVLKYSGKTLVGYTSEAYENLSEEVKSTVDYTYYYTDNDHAGTGYIVFEGHNRCTGTRTSQFTIKGTALSQARFSGFINTFTYNGQEQKQEDVTLIYGTELTEGEDYLVTYTLDTTNVGTVTVTYTGINGFTGTVKKTYRITAYNLTNDQKSADPKISISVLDDDGDNVFNYVKGGVTPLPVVEYNGASLVLNKDYTLRYANNTSVNSARTPTVTITGKGNFTGSISATFKIENQNIAADGLTLTASDKVYAKTKGNYTTSFSITDSDGKALKISTDYERNVVYSYTENVTLYDGTLRLAGDIAGSNDIVPVGTIMRITATGKGYYDGQISGTYRIVAGDISKASVRVYNQYYTGDEIRPDKSQIEIKLNGIILSAEDYEIVSYADNVNKGTAKLTINGVGDYGGTKTVNFRIDARTMNYVIIFNGNGSTGGSASNQTVAAGKTATLSANRYTRNNYTFIGWNTESDGSGISYSDKQQITNDGNTAGVNLILYAQWKPKTYNIYYHLNGGANNAFNTKLTYTAQDPTFTIYAPEREEWAEGYQFGGWYSDSAYKTRKTEIKSGSSGDINLYAKWIPYTYNVHFDGNGATSGSVSDETFSYGVSKALSPNKYGKKGYVFMGWAVSKEDADDNYVAFLDKENVVDLVSKRNNVNGEITLYAVWRKTFEIEYSLGGGTFGTATAPYEYTYGTVVNLINPTREGYVFGGWYLDDTYKKKITSISRTMSGDYYLYAKWTPYTYTISFNGNGNNSGSVRAQKYTYGIEASLNANSFSKKGYVFDGWNTVKNPTQDNPGVSYSDMEVINILPSKNNATITLYAQWKATDYSVSYILNGGSLSEDAENYISNYEYNHKGGYKLPTPVKTGCSFSGWYTDANYRTKITSIAQTSSGDLTLYASWDMTYTVVFDGNSQAGDTLSGSMADQKIKYSSSTYLRTNAYKSNSFIFMGWAVSKEDADNGIVTYTNGQKIQRPGDELLSYDAATDTYTLKLYAVWKNIFRISYELNGGEFTNPEQLITEYTYSKTQTYNLISPVRDGYTFAGWYTDPNFRVRVTNIARNSTGDKNLYAKWTSKNYKVNFVADPPTGKSATGRMNAQTLPYGVEKKLTNNAYKISGYSFVGWSLKKSSERTEDDLIIANAQSVDGIYDSYTDTVTLYAVWSRDTYSIIYNNVAGIDNSMNPDTYNVDDTITLAEPEALGNTFLGWYSDKNLRTKVTTIKAGTTGNKTFYAKWATTQYTIRYDLNAGGDTSAVLDTRNVGYINSYNDKTESGYRLATASRQGYTFAGWYKEATCRSAVGSIVDSPYVDMTVYAKWDPIAYTIRFDKNDTGATGTMKNMTVKYGTSARLTSNGFKKTNNTFSGWNTEKDGSGLSFSNGQTISNLTSEPGETVTLYAQWTPYSYKITYYLNKGSLPEDAPLGYSYGDEFELPEPTRENYVFLGWYEDKKFTESKKVTSITPKTAGNKTLYAKWKLNIIGDVTVPDEYLSLSDFGGYPNDGRSDSYALQDAIDRASQNASNGGINTIYLPEGVYNITDPGTYDHGIYLKSNVNLVMDKNAVLKVSGLSYGDYVILELKYVSNVTITGGQLVGERYSHSGSYGEWGHGIAMHGSNNITISNMSISGNWGDGIYMGTQAVRQNDGSQKYLGCTDIIISNCEIFDNRRNNISLTDADNITITDCNLYDAHGTAPQCCIYIEPNADSSDKVCEHILINNTIMTAYQNKNDDLYMVFMSHYNPYNLSYVTARDVRFVGCELNGFFGNYSGLGLTFENTSLNGTVVNLKAGQ